MILFEKSVLAKILAFTQRSGFNNESGGLLLGLRKKEHLHVTKATFPGKADQGYYNSFFRRDWSHQFIASKEWMKSGFRVDWIGEWHSHPENDPQPSATDFNTWREQTNIRKRTMVYLIIGIKSEWVGYLSHKDIKPTKLMKVEEAVTTILFNDSIS